MLKRELLNRCKAIKNEFIPTTQTQTLKENNDTLIITGLENIAEEFRVYRYFDIGIP